MEKKQERIVRCDEGEIRYLLERKRVKNLNLRVYRDEEYMFRQVRRFRSGRWMNL